jgi:hypothetical protein
MPWLWSQVPALLGFFTSLFFNVLQFDLPILLQAMDYFVVVRFSISTIPLLVLVARIDWRYIAENFFRIQI